MAWIQGLVLYALLLPWVGEFVGAIAWLGLAVVQSLYSLLFGLGLRQLLKWQRLSQSAWLMPAVAAWFVTTEWIRASWPFGGFAWVRIAWGQVGGPLAAIISLGGPALVTFTVVLTGGLIAVVVNFLLRKAAKLVPEGHRLNPARFTYSIPSLRPVPHLVLGGVVVVLACAAMISSSLLPHNDEATEPDRLNIAAVQGNVPRLGLDFNSQRRAVLDNHARQTRKLAEDVKKGVTPQPDLVMWPENASDVNPFLDQQAAEILSSAEAAIKAPILVGTVTPKHNRMVVWTQKGPQDQHDKRFLQPFGEYMPMRDFLRNFSDLVDRAGNFQPGHGNGVVTMAPESGQWVGKNIKVGVSTCYEVAFDESFRTAIRDGAQVLTTPTNNATFGFTDMTYQQLAMSRMRAIEYDRAVIVPATSGVSAIVSPQGEVIQESKIFTPDVLQAEVPLRNTITLSAVVGPWVEWTICAVGALLVVLGGAIHLADRSVTRKTKRKV